MVLGGSKVTRMLLSSRRLETEAVICPLKLSMTTRAALLSPILVECLSIVGKRERVSCDIYMYMYCLAIKTHAACISSQVTFSACWNQVESSM